MKFPAAGRWRVQFLMPVLIGSCFNVANSNEPAITPSRVGGTLILDGINNAATSATHFLTGVVQRQKELLHHVADSATDYGIVSYALVMAGRHSSGKTEESSDEYSNYDHQLHAASIGLDFKLRRLLEKFRTRMSHGFPEFGIPILEPLQLHELSLETNNPEIGELKITLYNTTIRGLTTFIVDRARLSLIGPTIAMNLTIPKLFIDGYYNMTGVIGDMFHIYGAGPLTGTVSDFHIFFETVLGYSRGMYLKSFELDFSIGDMDVNLGNFMNGSKVGNVMNEVLKELLPQAVEILKPEILPRVQDYIASTVNDTIYHLTMRDVLSFFIGENEIRKYPHLLQL